MFLIEKQVNNISDKIDRRFEVIFSDAIFKTKKYQFDKLTYMKICNLST